MAEPNEFSPMAARDWFGVGVRWLGVWTMYVGAIGLAAWSEDRIASVLNPPATSPGTGPWVTTGSLALGNFTPTFAQIFSQVALGALLLFGAPLLVRLCFGPDPELPPPSARRKEPHPASTDTGP